MKNILFGVGALMCGIIALFGIILVIYGLVCMWRLVVLVESFNIIYTGYVVIGLILYGVLGHAAIFLISKVDEYV